MTISYPKYLTEDEMWVFYIEEARRLLRLAISEDFILLVPLFPRKVTVLFENFTLHFQFMGDLQASLWNFIGYVTTEVTKRVFIREVDCDQPIYTTKTSF